MSSGSSDFAGFFIFQSLVPLPPGFAFTLKVWLVPGSLLCSVVRRRQCPLSL